MQKIIGVYGLTNTASFNVLGIEHGTDDCIIGGINATSLDDCQTYVIQNDINEDNEDGDSFIMVNGIMIHTSEIMHT